MFSQELEQLVKMKRLEPPPAPPVTAPSVKSFMTPSLTRQWTGHTRSGSASSITKPETPAKDELKPPPTPEKELPSVVLPVEPASVPAASLEQHVPPEQIPLPESPIIEAVALQEVAASEGANLPASHADSDQPAMMERKLSTAERLRSLVIPATSSSISPPPKPVQLPIMASPVQIQGNVKNRLASLFGKKPSLDAASQPIAAPQPAASVKSEVADVPARSSLALPDEGHVVAGSSDVSIEDLTVVKTEPQESGKPALQVETDQVEQNDQAERISADEAEDGLANDEVAQELDLTVDHNAKKPVEDGSQQIGDDGDKSVEHSRVIEEEQE